MATAVGIEVGTTNSVIAAWQRGEPTRRSSLSVKATTDGVVRAPSALGITTRAGQLKLVKVDVGDAPAISQRFAGRAVPTLPLINQGQVLARQSCAASVAVLRHWLEKSLAEHTVQEARS